MPSSSAAASASASTTTTSRLLLKKGGGKQMMMSVEERSWKRCWRHVLLGRYSRIAIFFISMIYILGLTSMMQKIWQDNSPITNDVNGRRGNLQPSSPSSQQQQQQDRSSLIATSREQCQSQREILQKGYCANMTVDTCETLPRGDSHPTSRLIIGLRNASKNHHHYHPLDHTTTTTTTPCKTLWITGMHLPPKNDLFCHKQQKQTNKKEGTTNTNNVYANSGDGFVQEYAAALQSWKQNAATALQPVLMLLHTTQNSTTTMSSDSNVTSGSTHHQQQQQQSRTTRFEQWVKRQGGWVIHVERLSFQSIIEQRLPEYVTDGRIGYFVRLDIPTIVKQHQLFNSSPTICSRYILYTDSDILFWNPIYPSHMNVLKQEFEQGNNKNKKILMYGQDLWMNRNKPSNTGVMVMNVPEFYKQWPNILKFGINRKVFPDHDQTWLNHYYASPKLWKSENILLPPEWNWKVYWNSHPNRKIHNNNNNNNNRNIQQSNQDNNDLTRTKKEEEEEEDYDVLSEVRIVHFHGPKPGVGVEEISTCNALSTHHIPKDYQPLVRHGICCDSGETAASVLASYRQWKPNQQEICTI